MNLLAFAYKFVTMKRFWLNQKEYLKIFKVCQNISFLKFPNYGKLLNVYFVHGFFAVFTIQCVIYLIAGKNFVPPNLDYWSPQLWLKQIVELARYSFFIGEKITQHHLSSNSTSGLGLDGEGEPEVGSISGVNGFLAFLTILAMFQRYVQAFFTDLCIFACGVTLWFYANSFAKSIIVIDSKKGLAFKFHNKVVREQVSFMETKWERIYEGFCAIQEISMAINMAVGSQVTLYAAESIIYYSLNLNAVMTMKSAVRRMEMVYFYVLNVGTFVISANICSQVK